MFSATGQSTGSSPSPRSPGRPLAARTTTPTSGTSSSSREKKNEKFLDFSEVASRAKKFFFRVEIELDFWLESLKNFAQLKKISAFIIHPKTKIWQNKAAQ